MHSSSPVAENIESIPPSEGKNKSSSGIRNVKDKDLRDSQIAELAYMMHRNQEHLRLLDMIVLRNRDNLLKAISAMSNFLGRNNNGAKDIDKDGLITMRRHIEDLLGE